MEVEVEMDNLLPRNLWSPEDCSPAVQKTTCYVHCKLYPCCLFDEVQKAMFTIAHDVCRS